MNACSFAAGLPSQESGVGAAFGAFHGQMGCIYLFEDVLNPGMPSFFVLALQLGVTACICIHSMCSVQPREQQRRVSVTAPALPLIVSIYCAGLVFFHLSVLLFHG